MENMKQMEMSMIYETLLTVPGMEDKVKIDLRIPRKTALLLVELLQHNITHTEHNEFLTWAETHEQSTYNDLSEIIDLCLEKSGLMELNHKLAQLKK